MAITWTEENATQEAINSWTHAIGLVASLPAGVGLVLACQDRTFLGCIACVVYALSLSSMYLFSTLSHAIRSPDWRHLFRRLDQGFVYMLIAGTFTPFICTFLTGWFMWTMLAFVWLSAFAGFYSKVLSRHRIDNMASLTYLLLGWVPSLVLFRYVPLDCFAWMAFGGILYSAGVWFLQNDHRGYLHHALWHVMVLAASGCHFLAVWRFTA